MNSSNLQQNVRRFSRKAVLYDQFRPRYPMELLAFLGTYITPGSEQTVADIAAGTGIFTEQIAQWGTTVFVVEPNRSMGKLAQTRLKKYKNCVFVNGTAEFTGLRGDSVDLVVSAQAFHWFDLDKAKAEFRRIGRKNLLVAVVWNLRNTESVFEQAYEALLRQFGIDYLNVSQRRMETEEVLSFFAPASPEYHIFEHADPLTFTQLQGRIRSYSFMPDESAADYNEMLEAIAGLFNRYQQEGKVRLSYKTRLFIGGIR